MDISYLSDFNAPHMFEEIKHTFTNIVIIAQTINIANVAEGA